MRKIFKWVLWTIGGLVGLVVLAVGVLYGWSAIRLNQTFDVKAEKVPVSSDPAVIERGRHLAMTLGKCGDCHGDDLSGKMVIDDPAVGTVAGPNITRAGVTGGYTDDDWVTAIRHGVRRDGSPVLLMPSYEYWNFDDQELGDIVSFLKSVPAVEKPSLENSVGPVGRLLYLADQVILVSAEKINHGTPPPAAPPKGPTMGYGKHIYSIGCGCHGPALAGGKIPGTPPDWPPAANLTMDQKTGLGSWTEQDFFKALREGIRPNGARINEIMPWKATAKMSDDEIRALWLYMKSVPQKKAGEQ